MSISEDKNVPELRFKGFTDAWEQRKLDKLATFSKGRGYSKSDLLSEGNPIILYGRLYTKYETVIEEVNTYAEKIEGSIISHGDEVIVPASGETSEDISRASVVARSGIIIGGDLNIINTNAEIDSVFLALTISNGTQQKELAKRAQGKSVVHIRNSDLKVVNLQYPNKEEQIKIGIFFKNIDKTIALHQEKLDRLEDLKKGYLRVIFPKEGENVPKIRLSNFDEEWDQRKLKDLTDSYSGGTPAVSNKSYYGGDIPFIRSGEINSNFTELFITNNGLNNSSAKLVKKGDILYALYGATSGEVGISKINGAINQAILAIRPINGDDSYLIAQWLRNQKNFIINTYLQGGQGNLSGNIVKNLMIRLPENKAEQTRIGMLLFKIENIIALHRRKIENLNNLKKAYLSKMFI